MAVKSLPRTLVPSGATVGGWTITYPVGITIETVNTGGINTLDLIKNANLDINEGLSITFTQTTGLATQSIIIDSENITNSTGTNWTRLSVPAGQRWRRQRSELRVRR